MVVHLHKLVNRYKTKEYK
uniref:Uncharacterized protein n=1 Tax=Anguilla anguilla TaxID=7936 RepID=A0A0E9T7D0_ANGAN